MGGPGSGRKKGGGKGINKPGTFPKGSGLGGTRGSGLHSSSQAKKRVSAMKDSASGKTKSFFGFKKPSTLQIKKAQGRAHYLKKAGY
jgi:hypothetical protein